MKTVLTESKIEKSKGFNLSPFISRLSSPKGFTLIELLVVISILGILAVIVLVLLNPGKRIASAKNSRVKADLASLGRAATVFYSDTSSPQTPACTMPNSYPQAFGAIAAGCTQITFPATLNDPDGVAYTIAALTVTGGAACTSAVAGPACGVFSISGPSYSDGNIVGGNRWCWKSSTGTVVQAATCAP